MMYNVSMNKLNCLNSSISGSVFRSEKLVEFNFTNLNWKLVVKDEFTAMERLGEMKEFVAENVEFLSRKVKDIVLLNLLNNKNQFVTMRWTDMDEIEGLSYMKWGEENIKKIMSKVTKNKRATKQLIWLYLLSWNLKYNEEFKFEYELD